MLRPVLNLLIDSYGPQHWWPADDAFEIMIGALLVQRTSWRNVELAMARLRGAQSLDPESIASLPADVLAHHIRPAGFYRMKAHRLRGLAGAVMARGGIPAMASLSTAELRQALLSLPGIGHETADAILLYAFERPVVVVDAYLRRLVTRLHGVEAVSDAELRRIVATEVETTSDLNEFHALIVEHGKRRCRAEPKCEVCCLRALCATAMQRAKAASR
jgi:endonuclease-3 related protein